VVAMGSGQGSLLVQSVDVVVSKGESPTTSLTTVRDLLSGVRLLYSRDQTTGNLTQLSIRSERPGDSMCKYFLSSRAEDAVFKPL